MEENNIVVKPMNIIFPLRGEGKFLEVLLAIKTRKIGVGLWNGYGGKVEPGESIGKAAKREFRKESTLIALTKEFKRVAIVDFVIHKSETKIVVNRCDILFVRNFKGTPKDTDEMVNPTWYPISKIPYYKMMDDAEYWMPQIFKGENIYAVINYTADRTKIIGSINIKQLR